LEKFQGPYHGGGVSDEGAILRYLTWGGGAFPILLVLVIPVNILKKVTRKNDTKKLQKRKKCHEKTTLIRFET
jgi:hypothetical protein